MKISIITPCYNAENTLLRTLESVRIQTVQPYEYIVIDGYSTDNSLNIIKNHPSVTKFISEKDSGIADAFNKGITLCTGDIICIINADDWYEADALEKVTEAFSENSVDIFHGALQYWDKCKKIECFYPNYSMLHKEMTLNHPTVFIRKSVYDKYGVFDTSYKYAMDYELLLRFHKNGAQFKQSDAVIANMSCNGISDKYWLSAYFEVAKAKYKYNTNFLLNFTILLFSLLTILLSKLLLSHTS